MQIDIVITSQPVPEPSRLPDDIAGQAGAVSTFVGLVRGDENGRTIGALQYEAYVPMAEQEMRKIVQELGFNHPCLYVQVIHRTGCIPVGEAAIRVVAVSRHRKESFAMVEKFMGRMKQEVPIWKVKAVGRESAL